MIGAVLVVCVLVLEASLVVVVVLVVVEVVVVVVVTVQYIQITIKSYMIPIELRIIDMHYKLYNEAQKFSCSEYFSQKTFIEYFAIKQTEFAHLATIFQ